MSAMNESQTSSPQPKENSRKKKKALLAGGVVLGLGAVMTLAAWSDNVFSEGTFQTGEFNLVGSKVPASAVIGDYAEYDTETTAAKLTTDGTPNVNFRIDSLNMTPGETVVAPFSVATDEDTSVAGRYWLEEASVEGELAPFLSFQIIQSPTCVADDPATTDDEQTNFTGAWKSGEFATDGESIDFGSVRSTAGTGPDIDLEPEFGNQSHLCIGVTLEDNEAGISDANATGADGQTSIVWHFAGQSLPTTN